MSELRIIKVFKCCVFLYLLCNIEPIKGADEKLDSTEESDLVLSDSVNSEFQDKNVSAKKYRINPYFNLSSIRHKCSILNFAI